MQMLNSSSDGFEKECEEAFKNCEDNDEPKFIRIRLYKKSISVPKLLDGDEEEPAANFNDKVGKKRQRKKDKSCLEKTKRNKKKKGLVRDLDNSAEIKEMWSSITNDNFSDGDKFVVNYPEKGDDVDDEIEKLFKTGKKKRKTEKNAVEIAMQVEEMMAILEIAVEDDVVLNREGKPAINKLMKLPLLNETLSKKPLQAEFLDHGVLNLLKNWLEPLPDGSLPNINIRTAVLKILDDLHINLDQDCRREQLIKSGLGKVIMFLSKSDEETTPNRRLANDLVNKWGRIIYNKSTRYTNMYTQEELDEQQQMLLRRQLKKAPKVSETKDRDFNIDVDLSGEPKYNLGPRKGVGRVQIPKAISMDFKINPRSKVDKELEARAKMQMDNSYIHENIITKLRQRKVLGRRGVQALKLSADGRTMLKYL